MRLVTIAASILAVATAVIAAPVPELEGRQLLNSVLCPLTGTPTCNLQCELLKQLGGQCSPQG